MGQSEVVVIGGCNLDIQGAPLAPGRAKESLPGKVTMAPGGAARNIAENLARLGNAVRLISAVGADAAGQRILTACAEAGVDVSSVCRLHDKPTSVYLSILDHHNELVRAINDMHIIEQMNPELMSEEFAGLSDCQALVFDVNLPPETLKCLFDLQLKPPIFVDCVSASKVVRLKPYLGKVHCLKPNIAEAELLWGKTIKDDKGLGQCADWLHGQGVAQVFISLGRKGLLASADGQRLLVSPKPTKVVSSSGSGDALLAGLVHGHLRQLDLAATADFAQACARLTLSHHSTVNPLMSLEAIEVLLAG